VLPQQSGSARTEENGSFFSFARDANRSRRRIYVLYANPNEFSDPTTRCVQKLDHGLIPHRSSGLDQTADVPNRHYRGQRAVPSPSTDETRRNRVYHAAQVQEVEEPAKRVEMAVIAINGEISLHQID
jgi:type IV secretory pathway VirB9-like protein